LVVSVNFVRLSWCSIVTVAPSIGFFCASRTLPFNCPVWAAAGEAHAARPSTSAQSATDRPKLWLPNIGTSIKSFTEKTA
jgi:hypothetical protein